MGEAPQVAQFARQQRSKVQVIAIAAPFDGTVGQEKTFRGFVSANFVSRFGNAPVNVYVDPKGTFWKRYYDNASVKGPSWDRHTFFSAKGTQLDTLPGYPFLQ
jgi:hypothetical protein